MSRRSDSSSKSSFEESIDLLYHIFARISPSDAGKYSFHVRLTVGIGVIIVLTVLYLGFDNITNCLFEINSYLRSEDSKLVGRDNDGSRRLDDVYTGRAISAPVASPPASASGPPEPEPCIDDYDRSKMSTSRLSNFIIYYVAKDYSPIRSGPGMRYHPLSFARINERISVECLANSSQYGRITFKQDNIYTIGYIAMKDILLSSD